MHQIAYRIIQISWVTPQNCHKWKLCLRSYFSAETRRANFCILAFSKRPSVSQFLSKSPTSLTFIIKINDSNRVHWEVQKWISRKRWQVGQALLLTTQKVTCGLLIGLFTFDLSHSKGQGHGHAYFDWNMHDRSYECDRTGKNCYCQQIENSLTRPFHWHIYIWHLPNLNVKVKVVHISIVNYSQMVTDTANIALTNKYEVAYGLSIGISTFDLDSFSRSRSCKIPPSMSLKWWQIDKHCYCQYIESCIWAIDYQI